MGNISKAPQRKPFFAAAPSLAAQATCTGPWAVIAWVIITTNQPITVAKPKPPTGPNQSTPGGSEAAARLHLARSIVRRAERAAVAAGADRDLNPLALQYLNRLSDHLFVMTRHINAAAGGDVLWKPGATR